MGMGHRIMEGAQNKRGSLGEIKFRQIRENKKIPKKGISSK